jgi:hypothetical protein
MFRRILFYLLQFFPTYIRSLQQASLSAARELSDSQKQTQAQTRRQTHAELQERLSSLMQSLRMFERGIKHLTTDSDTQQGLTKYLLKTLGAELAAEIFSFACQENLAYPAPPDPKTLTTEVTSFFFRLFFYYLLFVI